MKIYVVPQSHHDYCFETVIESMFDGEFYGS